MEAHPGVLFDVDGTLLDTNYQHVLAWGLAFRDAGHAVDFADLHRLIGIASSELVTEVLGRADEGVVEGHSRRYDELRAMAEPRVVSGAPALVAACAERGLRVVLATSGAAGDLDWMLPAIGAGDAVHGATTADSVERSKPAPDLLAVATEEHGLDRGRTVMVGDTVWDVEAAVRLGVACVAVTSGGIGERDLRAAGAAEVWAGCADLLDHLDESVLSRIA